ncbi:tryptophan synthase subunit alpha [Flavobacteriaceae bacterium 14752]|uniref:tryptophan synthase subunit alpha n=1 Tax=Mesohalobacter salilacus TaxID=2491711 RepID=UPI000F64330F|nr:tryptophan synthase subunit alpha [Flavobacteriaceae bacterium 14752]
MNRITSKLKESKKLLSIYFTAGFPKLEDTVEIIKRLQDAGVDMVEIGLPYSDPLADGPTIQQSSTKALKNGMSTRKLFEQIKDIRDHIDIPLIIMGYFNPMLQYGVRQFCHDVSEIGIDGLIMPDLPYDYWLEYHKKDYDDFNLKHIQLITPQTSEERIKNIDQQSKDAFIYMVSSSSTTGSQSGFAEEQLNYFDKIASYNLDSPQIVGFGIKDNITFHQATKHAKGAIIGSAFIKALENKGVNGIEDFVKSIRA